jgi:hypothetical protein
MVGNYLIYKSNRRPANEPLHRKFGAIVDFRGALTQLSALR